MTSKKQPSWRGTETDRQTGKLLRVFRLAIDWRRNPMGEFDERVRQGVLNASEEELRLLGSASYLVTSEIARLLRDREAEKMGLEGGEGPPLFAVASGTAPLVEGQNSPGPSEQEESLATEE